MKKQLLFLLTLLICLITGFFVYAITNDWIIIRLPYNISSYKPTPQRTTQCKKVHLYFWHENHWISEDTNIIWNHKTAENTKNLINCWLNLLDEEGIMQKKVTVQSVSLSQSKTEAYMSFDQNFLPKESSTFIKWMTIEGLLRTIRENKIQLQKINFLVHHKMLSDNQLDLTNAWPIEGFLQNA